MLASLLRPRRGRQRIDKSPFSTPYNGSPAANQQGNAEQEDDENAEDDQADYDEEHTSDDEDEDAENEPLLPMFSAALLDKLPLYNITHAIRMLIVQKCETTLSWDQLRSPQVSQFLVKPIQSQIRTNHFNRATQCALLANCLQFKKEAETNPGNAGVSRTRAMLAELLAMRLLKEFSTRELIDALSYDFDPLQGLSPAGTGANTPGNPASSRATQARSARISTVEIAIRATAKRFLAHPVVVQQLEAIWAGSIVFHSAADNLHRRPETSRPAKTRGYGTLDNVSPGTRPAARLRSKDLLVPTISHEQRPRRSVTLYDPRDASLFKLSRLRVPRYRQLFSTLSFAVMLGLFLAVLIDRSLEISPLEIVFWIWSAGYMLDEVVGFSEQGFGLYIMSVWNAFDLGILLMFFVYYVLRLYGVLIPETGKHHYANMAYDVLASTAILLFPRAFSVLDHYRYFSQLLIAFRLMAQDLVAILILIVISCSGFFVAFALSFSDEHTSGTDVGFALFQILLGFTPAAWNVWNTYNLLGQILMGFFLVICHFLIVTILVTVLTNSFMAIVQNANEEHQFLFAVNTISMVKSDALFSYIAPTNVLSWTVSPLRFMMPFRQFVKLNRTIIKVTHFPVLLTIFMYERVILSRVAYEPTDLVESKGGHQAQPIAFTINKAPQLFSPGQRLREASVVSYRKDRALEEVFRRPFKGSTVRTTARDMENERRPSPNVVDTWMNNVGEEGGASPPMEQPRSVLERLENRRPTFGRSLTAERMRPLRRDFSTATRSVISDPDDKPGPLAARRPNRIEEEADVDINMDSLPHDTEADGDDELVTADEGDDVVTVGKSSHIPGQTPEGEDDKENVPMQSGPDYFNLPPAIGRPLPGPAPLSHAARARLMDSPDVLPQSSGNTNPQPKRPHNRHASSNTILFQPVFDQSHSSASEHANHRRSSRPQTARPIGTSTPAQPPVSGRRTPKLAMRGGTRPAMPTRGAQQTAPDLRQLTGMHFQPRRTREPSFNAMALDLASELGDNRHTAADIGGISGMPASFSEQLFRERELTRRAEAERKRSIEEEKGMVGRIMLARMNTLEEGFREMLKEVRDLRKEGTGSLSGASGGFAQTQAQAQNGKRPNATGLTLRDTAAAGGASNGTSTPGEGVRTPLSITRTNSQKARRSPRKLQRRGTKGKEVERIAGVEDQDSPKSNKSEDRDENKRASVIFVGNEPDHRDGAEQGPSRT